MGAVSDNEYIEVKFLNWLKKLFNSNKHCEPTKEMLIAKMKLNCLSDEQIQQILENNHTTEDITHAMRRAMNEPDVNFLALHFLPEISDTYVRKNVPIQNVIDGVICGDIIGSKFEFVTHNYEDASTMTLPQRKSYHTDDTVLTKATWAAIQANPENPDFRQAYIDAYHKEPMAEYGSTFVNWALNGQIIYEAGMTERPRDNTVGYHSCANGCVMRIAPIPAYYDDLSDVLHHTIKSCMTTHNHVESVKASIILATSMWMALHGRPKQDISYYCKKHYPMSTDLIYHSTQFDMSTRLEDIPNTTTRNSLFANYAVPFVVSCFMFTDSYEACMREILSHYGDTDTLCAIAGGLCAAYYGILDMSVEDILAADMKAQSNLA